MTTREAISVRSLVSICVSVAVFAGTGVAAASETYPGKIMEYLETKGSKQVPACPVDCLLCHTSPNGGSNFMRPGFVDAMRDHTEAPTLIMFGPGRPDAIIPLMGRLEDLDCAGGGTAPCDTDMDGTSDVQELRNGTDPQGPGAGADCPQYGCGASIAPARPTERHFHGALAIGLLGLAAFFSRRLR